MSEKEIVGTLYELGLSRRETDVYLALSRRGTQGVNSIATILKMDRVQTYRILHDLQEKGIVETTLETPTRFSAIPLEVLIDSYIKTKESEIQGLETRKKDIIANWESLSVKAPEYPLARFRVIKEQKRVLTEIVNMIQDSENEFLELTTSTGIAQEDIAGVFDAMVKLAGEKPVHFKILTNITKENQRLIEQIMKTVAARRLGIQFRHMELGTRIYPRFIIRDDEEAILFMASRDELSLSHEDTGSGLWISSKIFVSTLRESFMEMWSNAVEAAERIDELRTGRPVGETVIIRGAQEAQTKLRDILDTAEEEVTVITSSDSINRILENHFLQNYSEKGLKIRLMAPIDLDNLEAADKLSEISEIRHVPISYLMMLMVDNRHLFMFKTPPTEMETIETTFYLENMFYTNDSRYVGMVSEMLNDIWKRGIDVKELSSGSGMKKLYVQVSSSETISKVIDDMLMNNVDSVIVTERGSPIGIIDKNDILRKILKQQRNPEKTYAKEIMSLPIIKIESTEPLTEALKKMHDTKITRLAVFKSGRLVGMLTQKPG